MASQQTIRELVAAINKSVEGFNSAIPGLQKQIASEIELLVKDLEIVNGRIAPSAKNLRIIGSIKAKIEKVILSREFIEKRNEYLKSFNEITKIQNKYFGQLTTKFKPTSVLKELQKQSIESTMESLSRAGISANVAKPVQDILRTNITSGAKYTDLAQQLRDFITTNQTGAGRLERYVKQITTDALNQYSRNYTKVVTDDLGLEWYMYTGAELETSRPFCQAMLDKKYFHKSEVPDLLDGDFPEFKKNDGKLNQKTGLPEGMINGTNTENFFTYAGGYNCGHQIVAVDESAVPDVIKKRIVKTDASPLGRKKVQPNPPDTGGTLNVDVTGLTKGIELLFKLAKTKQFENQFEKISKVKGMELQHTDKQTGKRIYVPNDRKVSDLEMDAARKATEALYEIIFSSKGQFKREQSKFDVYLVKGKRIYEADIKSNLTGTVSSIQHDFTSGNAQAKNIIIDFRTKVDKKIMIDGMIEGFRNAPDIDYAHVFYKNKTGIISRSKINKKDYSEILSLYK